MLPRGGPAAKYEILAVLTRASRRHDAPTPGGEIEINPAFPDGQHSGIGTDAGAVSKVGDAFVIS